MPPPEKNTKSCCFFNCTNLLYHNIYCPDCLATGSQSEFMSGSFQAPQATSTFHNGKINPWSQRHLRHWNMTCGPGLNRSSWAGSNLGSGMCWMSQMRPRFHKPVLTCVVRLSGPEAHRQRSVWVSAISHGQMRAEENCGYGPSLGPAFLAIRDTIQDAGNVYSLSAKKCAPGDAYAA